MMLAGSPKGLNEENESKLRTGSTPSGSEEGVGLKSKSELRA